MFFVYALCDPRVIFKDDNIPFKPFYIGKGSGDRPNIHIKEAKGIRKPSTKNTIKLDYIKDILTEGLEPIIIKIQEGLEHTEAHEIEIDYIKKYGRINIDDNGILTNRVIDQRSLGGGKKGMKHKKPRSEEHRKKISEYTKGKKWSKKRKKERCGKGNPMFGRNVKDITKELWKKQRRNTGENNPLYNKTGNEHPVTGYKHTAEECEARSKRNKQRFVDNPSLRKTLSKQMTARLSKKWQITSPDGDKIIINNLFKYCNEHNLKYEQIRNSRKGWKCVVIINE